MRDNISIIKYWIKALRKIPEFKELAKIEDLEFLRLYGETDRALNNLFIETADAYGVKRLEKIAGIYPEEGDTLEQRKARLYVYWNDQEPYTEGELKNRLENICGSDNWEVHPDYPNFLIQIITKVGGYGIFDEITDMLDYFLPANLLVDLQNHLIAGETAGIFCGVGTTTALSYELTNDIKADYPVSQKIYSAIPTSVAHNVVVTNDIYSKNELSEGKTVASAVSYSQIITTY